MATTTALPGTAGAAELGALLDALVADQQRARLSLNLTPSENTLSPLARLPFVLDTYSRYYFDHLRMFGSWSFYGSLGSGAIEQRIVQPLLRELLGVEHVNVQPLSGLNCMLVAMGALAGAGDTVVTVPVEYGGHISTAGVASRLGMTVVPLPMAGPHRLDEGALAALLERDKPALVYLDQSTQLFPLDPQPIRDCIDGCSPRTLLHFDSSHINGLILGGAVPNPLDRGAHTVGGSTHKTLPGPHKGFLATRRGDLAQRIDDMSGIFVSHHHPADVASLGITLLEMKHCDGAAYAERVVANARQLGAVLHARGLDVSAAEMGFTDCHQIWVALPAGGDGCELGNLLYASGIHVNRVGVPEVSGPALRLSSAEITRMGAGACEIAELGDLLADAILTGANEDALRPRAECLRARLGAPKYCFDVRDSDRLPLPAELATLVNAIVDAVTHPGSTGDPTSRAMGTHA